MSTNGRGWAWLVGLVLVLMPTAARAQIPDLFSPGQADGHELPNPNLPIPVSTHPELGGVYVDANARENLSSLLYNNQLSACNAFSVAPFHPFASGLFNFIQVLAARATRRP